MVAHPLQWNETLILYEWLTFWNANPLHVSAIWCPVPLIAKPSSSQYTVQLCYENWSIPNKTLIKIPFNAKHFIDRHLHHFNYSTRNIVSMMKMYTPLFEVQPHGTHPSQINYSKIQKQKSNNKIITKLFRSRRLKINWPSDLNSQVKPSSNRWILMFLLFSSHFLVHLLLRRWCCWFFFFCENIMTCSTTFAINLRQPENSHAN